MAVNRKRIREWVNALRSGEYEQTTGGLKREDAYCCLGVACELSKLDQFNVYGEYLGYGGTLPVQVVDYLGVPGTNPVVPREIAKQYAPDASNSLERSEGQERFISLASLNDYGATFLQIADIIEAMWLK